MSSSPEMPARSTTMAAGGLPGLVRAAATQTSARSVLSGTMAQPVLPADGRDRADLRRGRARARRPGRPAPAGRRAAPSPGCPGDADIRRILAVGHLQDQHGGHGEDPRGAGRRRRRQPVEGLGRVDVQGRAGQRGQHGRGPLGALPGPRSSAARPSPWRAAPRARSARSGRRRPPGSGRARGRRPRRRWRTPGSPGSRPSAGRALISRQTSKPLMSGRFTSSRTSSAASSRAERLLPGADLGHGVTRPPQPGRQEVALGLVVVDEQQRRPGARSSSRSPA